MRPGRQIVRLAAVMIAMIIAYAAPSVAQAHGGHAHHGPAMAEAHAVAYEETAWMPAVPTVPATLSPDRVPRDAGTLEMSPAAGAVNASTEASTGSIKAGTTSKGCCPGGCRGSCCGTMACHGAGILSGPSSLPTRAFIHVMLTPHDVAARPSIGPEALPKPPRPLA